MNTFTKIFFGTFVSSIALLSLAGYAGNKAFEADPQLPEKISGKFSDNVVIRVGGFSSGKPGAGSYIDNEDSWALAVPTKKISLKVKKANIAIKQSTSKEVKIFATGKFAKMNDLRMLETNSSAEELAIAEPADDIVQDLELKIEIPMDFTGSVSLATISGDITVEKLVLDKFSLDSVSGDLVLNQVKAKDLEINVVSGDFKTESSSFEVVKGNAVSGDFEIGNLVPANIDLTTVSGDVKLKLQTGEDTLFKLKTLSGDIQNKYGSNKAGKHSVAITTTSGDIEVE